MTQTQKNNILSMQRGKKQQKKDDKVQIANLREELETLSQRIEELETNTEDSQQNDLAQTAQKLRDELVDGLRILGERVSGAIQDMENRFEEYQEKHLSAEPSSEEIELEPVEDEGDFGSLREPAIVEEEAYEVISKANVARLAEAFRKQSESINAIADQHQQKFTFYEHQMDARDQNVDSRLTKLEQLVKLQWIGMAILLILAMILKFI
jgi:hypothetical protein